MTVTQMKQLLIRLTFTAAVVLLFYLLMKGCLKTILPLVIGFALAVAVQRPAAAVGKRFRLPVGTVAMVMVLAVYGAVFGLTVWLFSRGYDRLVTVYEKLPEILADISDSVGQLRRTLASHWGNTPLLSGLAGKEGWPEGLAQPLLTKLSAALGHLATAVPGLLFNLLFTVIAGCYTAADYPRIVAFSREALPDHDRASLARLSQIAKQTVGTFLKGYGLLSGIGFLEMGAYFTLIGQKNGIALAALIALVDVLPVLGSGVILLPWALVSLLGRRYWFGIGLVALYVVMTVVRNALEPKLVGRKAGLPPLLALLTLILGLRLFGAAGMIVLPFVTAVLLRFVTERFAQRNDQNALA